MPRSTIANRREYTFDAATSLRDYNAVAISATTTETTISLAATKLEDYKCVVDVAAYSGYSAGSAQWTITVEASSDNSAFTVVGSVVPNGTANRFDIPLSGEWVEDLVSGAIYLRAKATKTGTPGNLTYGAWLNADLC